MTAAEFTEGPAQEACLTGEEKLDILMCICSVGLRTGLMKRLPKLNMAKRLAPFPEIPQLTTDADYLMLPLVGATDQFRLINPSKTRLAFKVKCTGKEEFHARPVFGFLESGASTPVEIVRQKAGRAHNHYAIAYYAYAPSDFTDPEEPFKEGLELDHTMLEIRAK